MSVVSSLPDLQSGAVLDPSRAVSTDSASFRTNSLTCLCGCNSEALFTRLVPNCRYADPESNFRVILSHFARRKKNWRLASAISSAPLFQDRPLDLYLLFHIVLRSRAAAWRLHWRGVLQILGFHCSKKWGKLLKSLYQDLLKDFDFWVRRRKDVVQKPVVSRPVSVPKISPESPVKRDRGATTATNLEPQQLKHPKLDPDSQVSSPQITLPVSVPDLVQPVQIVPSMPPISNTQAHEALVGDGKVPETPEFTPEHGLRCKGKPVFKVGRPNNAQALCLIKKPRIVNEDKFKELHSLFVPNPMTTEFRLLQPSMLGFETEFKTGYLPIQLQSEQEQKDTQSLNDPRIHFIRRKQSAINIKRCCGVTYVLPSESKQTGVREKLAPLPPLAFQVGTMERCHMTEAEETATLTVAKEIIKHIFDGRGCIAMTVLDGCEEETMKNYLLTREGEGEVLGLQDVSELWRFLYSGSFVALHFLADSDQLLFPALPSETRESDIIVGFTTKKGLCGTKSVKRCLEMEACDGDTLNTYANSIKLELYLSKELWQKASVRVRKLLCCFITAFECEIRKKLNGWNDITREIYETKITRPGLGVYSYIRTCGCALDSQPNKPGEKWDFSIVELKHSRNTSCCRVCRDYLVEISYFSGRCGEKLLQSKNPPNLYYLINTRDSFSYDLTVKETPMEQDGRKFTKMEFYFQKDDIPATFKDAEQFLEGDLVRAGVTGYMGVFTPEELDRMEDYCAETEEAMKRGEFLEDTAQASYGAGGSIKRTKFFFGSRYMWTACQLAERQSNIAAGVRTDVSPTPHWMQSQIVCPLERAGIVEPGFINSIAMNIYHDGTEGLAQHFDDATRFHQPIYTVKLGSDARLSFGSQFYGFCNGAFCVPCPRGVVCVMEEYSYAANRAKHCVRPCDLTGRSITMILRQIHPKIMVSFT